MRRTNEAASLRPLEGGRKKKREKKRTWISSPVACGRFLLPVRGEETSPCMGRTNEATFYRLCRALGGAEKVEIDWGNHALSNRVQEAVQAIMDFVKREGPKGWDDPWS
ncbi:hypothetical protein BHE74_00037639 [Ensete ventricosum]|nr:hypothetical protein GW17_00048478 [Ensete ventricosum]RWW55697.1 hypothetical protein BHE74_00037639 [Ensete ventricosum]